MRSPTYYEPWLRPLSRIESAVAVLQERRGAGGLARVVVLGEAIDQGAVEAATCRWQERHPRLRQTYRRRGTRRWLTACDRPIPVAWREGVVSDVVEAELNDRSWQCGDPLVRITIIPEGPTTAVFWFHHVTGDGRTASRLIDDLLGLLAGSGEPPMPVGDLAAVDPPSPARIDRLRDRIGVLQYAGAASKRQAEHEPHAVIGDASTDRAPSANGSGLVTSTVASDDFDRVRSIARSSAVGFTTVLGACLLRATAPLITDATADNPTSITITTELPVPNGRVRPAFNTSGVLLYGPNREGLLAGSGAATDVLEHARALHRQWRARHAEYEPLWATYLQRVAIVAARNRTLATIGLSNLGRLPMAGMAGPGLGVEMWGGAAVHGLRTAVVCFVGTTERGTYASFVHDRSMLGRDAVLGLVGRWHAELASVVALSHP